MGLFGPLDTSPHICQGENGHDDDGDDHGLDDNDSNDHDQYDVARSLYEMMQRHSSGRRETSHPRSDHTSDPIILIMIRQSNF